MWTHSIPHSKNLLSRLEKQIMIIDTKEEVTL